MPMRPQRERGRLAEILADCVNGGSSVSFMWPFTVEDAASWWDGVIKTVESGRTVLFGGYVAGSLVGTVQLSSMFRPTSFIGATCASCWCTGKRGGRASLPR